MKKLIIILILILSASEVKPQKVDNFYELDSIWNAQKENEHFSRLGCCIYLTDFYYYKEIQSYMDSIFLKNILLIRIINAQKHWINLYSIDFIFNPDVCFLYKKEKTDEWRLVYWDKNHNKIINKIINSKIDVNYLLKAPNFYGFKIDWERASRNRFSFLPYGTGISISVYSPRGYFSKSIEEFWKNHNDVSKVEFFNEVQGKQKTIKLIRQLLLDLRADVNFDAHCRDCYSRTIADSIYQEYKKIRHKVIDVEAVERREKEWKKNQEINKK